MHWAWIDNYGVEATMRLRFCHCDATKRHQHHCHYFFNIYYQIESLGSFLYMGGVRVASNFVTLLQKPYLSIII